MPHSPTGDCESLRSSARDAAEAGRADDAAMLYRKLLGSRPDDLEALNFLGVHAMAHGWFPRAREMLERALSIAPTDGATRKNLGITLLQSGEPEAARRLLSQAVGSAPDFFTARLYLGLALERLGQPHEALAEYFRAIASAQAEGYWLSPASTPAGLRPVVEHASRFVRAGHRRLLHAVLAPLHARHGRAAMARVDRCLDGYLGEVACKPGNPDQRPTFLYFPGLPETPILSRELFPWYERMEASTDAIREELLAVLAADADLEPFLGEPPPGMKSDYLASSRNGAKAQWDGLFFHRHGRRNEENCRRCPATAAALEAAPTVHIRDHSPEALFSVLGAGSHILPHTGMTNTRLVTHLPLLVPGDCSLRVADQRHDWQQGRCVTFDDTFEHEAWNNSDRTRVILLFDIWNPHLTGIERTALAELVPAIAGLTGEQLAG